MTEILTESFCERCGTRYTFESVAPRQGRMGGIRVLGRGLKNFVLSDDSSLDEAFAAARSDAEREATTQQLDAFHKTFNFCMSCRQYTCSNCWNAVEARCLSCAPLAEAPVLQAPLAEPDADRLLRFVTPAEGGPASPEMIGAETSDGWPSADLPEPPDGQGVWDTGAAPEADAVAASEPAAELEPEAELEAELEPPIIGLQPGESLEDAIAAYEASVLAEPQPEAISTEPELVAVEPEAEPVAAEPEPEPEAVAAAPEPEPEPVAAAPEAELVAAEPEPAAEPVAAEPEAELVAAEPESAAKPVAAEPEAELVAAEPESEAELVAAEPESAAEPVVAKPEPVTVAGDGAVDHIEQPTWPIAAAPEAEAPPAQPAPPLASPMPAPLPGAVPQWPTGPRWPTGVSARQAPVDPAPAGDPLAALMARQATEAMWTLSSRDVVQPRAQAQAAAAAVRPCVNCGISLSANAHFCRRCGTSQEG
ncbi:MAG: hypothetical protein HYX57_06810 [Chloroflexi bacterium]|nr:hypothetical protein [Chloroflexota bacterium]